jgi:F-type H+-transporting ATPase subunit a
MRLVKAILIFLVLGFAPLASHAQVPDSTGPVPEHVELGLSAKAGEVFKIGSFPVTNSMIVTWVVALFVIIFAQIATRKISLIPKGVQNFWEFLVESLYNFLADIVGRDLVRSSFWFFATIFIFILFTNWFGLIPGVGTIGWGEQTANGFEVTKPLLRGGNADLNMTFAMSSIFMVCWLIWALKSNGIVGFALHLFGPKGESTGVIKYIMIVVFFAVGFLELLSIAFRPISLSFRLYGNIFAGENLLDAMSKVVQHPAWLKSVASVALPVPFYFFEILVGIVQALVFMLLTAVFTALICSHGQEHGEEHGKEKH